MNKILTIVIPTYNMEALLPRCLDSMTKPAVSEELEVLVVNDGSRDNSLTIAQKYEKDFPGVIYAIDKPNGNYGSTINKGIELATGKYFRICDSDDFYDNKSLMQFISELKTCNTDMVLSDYVIDRDSHSNLCKITGLLERAESRLADIDLSRIGNYAMHGLTVKTAILKDNNINLTTGISYTDTEYCYYPLGYANSISYYSLPVYRYQVGRDGQTVSLESQIRCLSHMRKIIYRIIDDLEKSVGNRVYENKCYMASRIINLYYSTALCYDTSNKELAEIESIDKLTSRHKCIDKYLRNNTMFGVPFYKRFHDDKKLSNRKIFRTYYTIVKSISKSIRKVIGRL